MDEVLTIDDYPIRVCVNGSRSFHDQVLFKAFIQPFLDWFDRMGLPYCFISGAAKRGADALIIALAKELGKDCFEYPADWHKYGKRAGYLRNAEMREIQTHLLSFWDGESKGTLEMIDNSIGMENVSVMVISVEPDAQWSEYCRKKQQRGHW